MIENQLSGDIYSNYQQNREHYKEILDRQRFKAEIMTELKAYTDNTLKINFQNAASPLLKELHKEIQGLFS